MPGIVDPVPWHRAERDEKLEALKQREAAATTEEELTAIKEERKQVRRHYRRQLMFRRLKPW